MTIFERVKQWLNDIKERLQWFIEETDFTRLFIMFLIIVFCICSWTMAFLVLTKKVHAEDININAIIMIESSGNPNAVSEDYCIGLMQISQSVLDDWNNYGPLYADQFKLTYSTSDLYRPKINMAIGNWYINRRIPDMFRNYNIPDTINNRLIAYNWGIGNLKKHIKNKNKLPKETQNYIKKYHKISGDLK